MFFTLSNNSDNYFSWYSLSQEEVSTAAQLLVVPFNSGLSGADKFSIRKVTAPVFNQTVPFQLQEFQKKSSTSITEYCQMVSQAIHLIKEKQLQKLVLSRTLEIPFKGEFPMLEILSELKKNNPNAYVYAFKTKNEIWLGASPETFIKFQNNKYSSFALAGTIPHVNNLKLRDWTEKEREEQGIVTRYILDVFSDYFKSTITKSKTNELYTSNLCHLLTEIEAIGEYDDKILDNLIDALHPTPAVCGFPTSIAKTQLDLLENHDRELYSGIFVLKQNYAINSFVNLRCMKVSNNNITLYAGGGITADSSPELEWIETEHKLDSTLKTLLSLSN